LNAHHIAYFGSSSWKPPKDDPKYAMWCAFKDSYRQRMVADGDYICRTLPFPLVGTNNTTEAGAAALVAADAADRLLTRAGESANLSPVGSRPEET